METRIWTEQTNGVCVSCGNLGRTSPWATLRTDRFNLWMDDLNAMTDAMMMTTRLIVFPTACVIGWTRPSAMNAT